MPRLLPLLAMALAISLAGCAGGPQWLGDEPEAPLSKIVGFDEEKYFVDAQGRRFFPWGFNYTHPAGVGLIDDDLYSEDAWRVIDQDFAEMKSYTANVARVHLQYHRFMLDPATPDPHAFAALDRLVNIAEAHRMYLLITGLGAYRKADSPQWYNQLSAGERWQTQALFWQALAAQIGHSGAVFAYDLMNEPTVSVCPEDDSPCSWSVGEPLGDFHFIQNITLDSQAQFLTAVTRWKNTLHAAIRKEDGITLTTVGHLPFVPFNRFTDNLDFLSIHVYPEQGDLGKAIGQVRAAVTARPLLISEYFNMLSGRRDIVYVLNAIEGDYQGLLGHYNGRTQEELFGSGDPVDKVWGEFLEFFVANNPNTAANRESGRAAR